MEEEEEAVEDPIFRYAHTCTIHAYIIFFNLFFE
jgi:hypothetical protein